MVEDAIIKPPQRPGLFRWLGAFFGTLIVAPATSPMGWIIMFSSEGARPENALGALAVNYLFGGLIACVFMVLILMVWAVFYCRLAAKSLWHWAGLGAAIGVGLFLILFPILGEGLAWFLLFGMGLIPGAVSGGLFGWLLVRFRKQVVDVSPKS